MNGVPWNWETMPMSSAACFVLAGLLLICFLILVISAHRDPVQVELRAIRRKRRQEKKLLTQTRALIKHRDLAKHRVDTSLRTTRAFISAYRQTHR